MSPQLIIPHQVTSPEIMYMHAKLNELSELYLYTMYLYISITIKEREAMSLKGVGEEGAWEALGEGKKR